MSVAQGSNAPTQTVSAQNIGTGSLNLTASSTVTWLAPTVGTSQQCGISGLCIPVAIAVQSSSLANGTYTGTVTITDPNAVDAPQFVTVTVNVGGAVPNKLEFYLAPGSSTTTSFTTGTTINPSVDSAPWLSIAVNGSGSFSFNVPYIVTATASSGMTPQDYNGTLTISGSKFAPDNKRVPLLLHVTTNPILQVAPASLNIKIAQGANKQTSTNGSLPYLSTANTGQGTLTISSSSASTSSGSNWLSTSSVSGFPSLIAVTADPTGLSPGVYQGTITIASNAANSSVVVPVQLTVEKQNSPVAFPGGVVNNGTFVGNQLLALGDIAAVFGDQFTYGDPASASSLPLGTTLGNTQVMVNGTAAPVYYVSPGQINFQIPFEAATGDSTIQVIRNGTPSNTIYANIASAAPSFLLLNGGYVIMTTPAGALTGISSAPAHANDVVVIYTIGLGPTSPAVPSGTGSPSSPPATVTETQVCFSEHAAVSQPPVCSTAQFSGLTPGFVGLYQINVQIPTGLPTGNVPIYFTVAGQASDQEMIALQ
ncbi:MAG TPA: hypothetical protein VEV37_09815 [Bryobacteraceae bacterium]|nr:hypothetical protein [Bryobacteraceae bacterium]